MVDLKEQIMGNLEYLTELQLKELAEFSTFLKVRSRIKNLDMNSITLLNQYSDEDKSLAESGMAEYNAGLLEEDKL